MVMLVPLPNQGSPGQGYRHGAVKKGLPWGNRRGHTENGRLIRENSSAN